MGRVESVRTRRVRAPVGVLSRACYAHASVFLECGVFKVYVCCMDPFNELQLRLDRLKDYRTAPGG